MENVNILFGSYIDQEEHYHLIGIIEKIPNSKVKDYLSLSNKTIFKCFSRENKIFNKKLKANQTDKHFRHHNSRV